MSRSTISAEDVVRACANGEVGWPTQADLAPIAFPWWNPAPRITRKNPTLPLTAYFDPVAYGIDPLRKKARVHVLRKRGEAA